MPAKTRSIVRNALEGLPLDRRVPYTAPAHAKATAARRPRRSRRGRALWRMRSFALQPAHVLHVAGRPLPTRLRPPGRARSGGVVAAATGQLRPGRGGLVLEY